MSLFQTAIKLNNLFAGKIPCQSSLLEKTGDVQNGFETVSAGTAMLEFLTSILVTWLTKFIYTICTFVMNFIEVIQLAVCRILGITVDLKDFVVLDTTNPLVKLLLDDTVLRVFKWAIGIAIVLIILFTILSIAISEYRFATESSASNSKGRILGRTLRSFFTLGMFPLILILGIVLTNAILAGFNDILRNGENTSIASQIFIASSYNANNYRNYADKDARMPVIVNFDDPVKLGQEHGYSTDELAKIYKSFQEKGRAFIDNYADGTFDSFSDTIVYRNNKLYNKKDYSGFEQFVCTKEQYYVLADFIDYAVKNNVKFYVKSMADIDIDWKYVDESVYDKENGTLSITYKDYSNLNNGKSYKVIYSPTQDRLYSPISDAIKTISALLGFGDYEDNTFNVLKRLENSINIVEWETDKVLLRLSDDVRELILDGHSVQEIKNKLTPTDKLILFERASKKSNNTINATMSELIEGFELPLKKVTKRVFQLSSASYITTSEEYVVELNNTYYKVEKNENLKDDKGNFMRDKFGSAYYTLVETDFDLVETTKEATNINENDKIDLGPVINGGESLGLFAKTEDSYKDIRVVLRRGDYNVEQENGEIYTATYDDIVNLVVKQSAFPNKLINDLQVIFKDININNLISTGKWLEQLGEYVGGNNIGGLDTSNIQTGLIHPLGLIMSEMFLGSIGKSDFVLSLGSLEFSSKFDADTIRALIAATLGEDRYFQTAEQLKYFNEFFNILMAPILDELAYYENFELLSGNEQSVQLYTYKAYLASVLLSSNAAGWFYQNALTMLGANNITSMIFKEGTFYSYSELEKNAPHYAALVKNIFNAAVEKLKKQFVYKGDKAYPEYLDTLEAYINGALEMDGTKPEADYFKGRLELILKNYLSSDGLAKEVDNKKQTLKSKYKELINSFDKFKAALLNSGLSEADATEATARLRNYVLGQIIEPSSSFSFALNDFDDKMEGERAQDLFDKALRDADLTRLSKELSKAKADIKEYLANKEYLPRHLNQNIVLSGSDYQSFLSNIDAYFSSAFDYTSIKTEYVTPDTSSSYLGEADSLQKQINTYFDQAKKLFGDSKVREYINRLHVSFDFSTSKSQKDFSSQAAFNKLKAELAALENEFNGLDFPLDIELIKRHNDTRQFIDTLKSYIRYQEMLDKLYRYEITFAIDSSMTSDAVSSLEIVVNNKHYTVGQNFTKGKFVEYILGSKVLKELGLTNVFVSDDFEGIVKLIKVENSELEQLKQNYILRDDNGDIIYEGGKIKYDELSYELALMDKYVNLKGSYYKYSNCFDDVHDFAVELGEMAAALYQLSNLANLSPNTLDELILGDSITKDGVAQEPLSAKLLRLIVSEKYLPEDLISAFFGISLTDSAGNKVDVYAEAINLLMLADGQQANDILNTVLSYLFVSEPNEEKTGYVDYCLLTLKEIRIRALNALIDFEQQEGDSTYQNQQRYLTLLALGCADWVAKETFKDEGGNSYQGPEMGAVNGSWSIDRAADVIRLEVSNQSRAIILKLAGLENRPYAELVDAKYSIDFGADTIDEKNGDIFIICTRDEESNTFIPFMMTNKRGAKYSEEKVVDGKTWMQTNNFRDPYCETYASDDENQNTVFFPVIAKGIVNSKGQPTAIREVDGNIEYYRDEVVIRDVSKIGLEQYFLSADQIRVNHTGLSLITNAFSKLVSGKTLVEHIATSIPRYAAHANINLCYGVEDRLDYRAIDQNIAISYNFGRAGNFDMDNVYDIDRLNILVLIIGVVCMITALTKALWGGIARVFDITIDFLLGPLAISTISLKQDLPHSDSKKRKKGETQESSGTGAGAYDTWKNKTIKDVISVIGYAIGFNIFFIIVPIINGLELFPDASAFASLPLFRKISTSFLNEIGRLLFLIAAAYMSTRGPQLFVKLFKNMDNAFERGADAKKAVNSMVAEVRDTWSGQRMVDQANEALYTARQMIPGIAIKEAVQEKVQKVTSKVAGKAVEWYARANGCPKELAKALGTEFSQAANQASEAVSGKKQREEQAKARHARMNARSESEGGGKPY